MTIRVEGLTEFRAGLKAVDPGLDKELKAAHKKIAAHVQSRARANAASAGGTYAKAKSAINQSSSAKSAAVGVSKSTKHPYAQATFWGAKRRTGWYAQEKYAESTGRQFEEWVGNNWTAATPGEGPYVINYTVAEELPQIEDEYLDAMGDLYRKAFPESI